MIGCMAKRGRNKPPSVDIATLQPDELNQLKIVVKDYIVRRDNIENEIAGLRESLKDLNDEFKEKIDLKTLNSVIKVLKIESTIEHRDNYDSLYDVMRDDFVNSVTDEP